MFLTEFLQRGSAEGHLQHLVELSWKRDCTDAQSGMYSVVHHLFD